MRRTHVAYLAYGATETSQFQWQIQDFLNWGANPWLWDKKLMFGRIFAENFMKMKEIGSRGGHTSLIAPT